MFLKQSTAVDVVLGPFVDDTDGKTTEEALTLSQADLQLTKNGAAAAQKSDATSATHLYGGNYKVPLNATDTNTLGQLRLMCKEPGALPVIRDFMVLPANVFDSLIANSDKLQVDTTQVGGTTQTARDLGASVLLSPGTGAGQVSLSSGAVTVATNNDKLGYALSAAGVDAVLDEVVEGTYTLRQAMRLLLSLLGGKASGGGTTAIMYRDTGDTKDRVLMAVDSNGNRSAVTLDLT